MFIIQEELENVEVYLSAPDGHSLEIISLSFHANDLTERRWRAGEIKKYIISIGIEEKIYKLDRSMMEQGQIEASKPGPAAPPESLDLHLFHLLRECCM
ncbi:MAG: hypothetical protein U5K79_16500 [Cyclobacteriaceae bacterium]|nr:hypothetical protein [Cyclobacteriaceae bacterium]